MKGLEDMVLLMAIAALMFLAWHLFDPFNL